MAFSLFTLAVERDCAPRGENFRARPAIVVAPRERKFFCFVKYIVNSYLNFFFISRRQSIYGGKKICFIYFF